MSLLPRGRFWAVNMQCLVADAPPLPGATGIRRYCAGQSNMWLPMRFSFAKNETFERLQSNYAHIRTLQVPNIAVSDAQRDNFWVLPPEIRGQGGFAWRPGWERPTVESVEVFGAACWLFAQELSDLARAKGETVVPFGLIGSYWCVVRVSNLGHQLSLCLAYPKLCPGLASWGSQGGDDDRDVGEERVSFWLQQRVQPAMEPEPDGPLGHHRRGAVQRHGPTVHQHDHQGSAVVPGPPRLRRNSTTIRLQLA